MSGNVLLQRKMHNLWSWSSKSEEIMKKQIVCVTSIYQHGKIKEDKGLSVMGNWMKPRKKHSEMWRRQIVHSRFTRQAFPENLGPHWFFPCLPGPGSFPDSPDLISVGPCIGSLGLPFAWPGNTPLTPLPLTTWANFWARGARSNFVTESGLVFRFQN